MCYYLLEVFKVFLVGQVSEQKKVSCFLKAVSSVLFNTVNEVADIITSVDELTGSGALFTLVDNVAVYTAYICKTYNNTASVVVTKSSLYIVLVI